jgi:zinc protease
MKKRQCGVTGLLCISNSVFLAILVIASTPLAQTEKPAVVAKPGATAPLPAAKDVIARFIKLMGGKEAFSKIKSQHGKGKFSMPAQGLEGDLEVFALRPNKLLTEMTISGIGKVQQGFDGTVGWSLSVATGPMLQQGKQLQQAAEQAQFDSVLHNATDYKSMENLGEAEFQGRTVYKLKLIKNSDVEVTEYYDKESGMLIGSTSPQETPLGPMMVINLAGDYKRFGDVYFPTKVVQKVGPIEQIMTITSYEFNTVDPKVFELPAEIKTLIKK